LSQASVDTLDILAYDVGKEGLAVKRLDCSLGGFARVFRETAKRASITPD
jgi:hypothetical protein